MWEWFSYKDHTLLLNDLQKNTELIMNHLGIVPPNNKLQASSVHLATGPHLLVDRSPARYSWSAVNRDGKVILTVFLSGIYPRQVKWKV